MDQKEDILTIVKEYKKRVQKEFPVQIEQFYLFGSYAKGVQRENSDIDVAMIVSRLDDNYDINTEMKLYQLRRGLDMRIEPHLIARDEDYSYFVREIERTGIEITL
jgi:predicted nucleotidyltransferase